MSQQVSIPILEDSQPGEARRIAARMAAVDLQFDEETVGRVSIVATELARNLHKHAQNGELLLSSVNDSGAQAMELVAIDSGPGMVDVEKCMRDGYSTSGTPGHGLGAISRLSNYVDIYSVPKQGTVLMSRVHGKRHAPERQRMEYGVVNLAVRGETKCGDGFAVRQQSERCVLMVADGLGHGPDAAKAAEEAIRVLDEHAKESPCEILEVAHSAMRATRGAAVSICEIALSQSEIHYAGVGNVSGSVFIAGTLRSMVSHNGTVGHTLRKCQEFTYPWAPSALLVMYSDGLGTQWDLNKYPGLPERHPTTVAAVIYRDFKRGRDDVTVLVARERRDAL